MLIAIALAAAAAQAAPAKSRPVYVSGVGNDTCGRWTKSRSDGGDTAFVSSWLGGYLSGANVYGRMSGTAGYEVKFSDYELWMTNYCQLHTFDTIQEAADKLIIELEARRH